MTYRKLLATLAVSISLLAGAFLVHEANAQVMNGLNAVGETVALSAADPRVIAARIINVALGFLGIIFLGIILYAGFLWMTAGGDPSKVDKAKSWIRNGVIGLVIILASWAIAYYVINALLNATGGGGGLGGGGTPPGGGLPPGGGGINDFRLTNRAPVGIFDAPNLEITIGFSQDVTLASMSQVTISPAVNGAWVAQGTRLFKFQPSDPCPGYPTKKCFALDTPYTVTVPNNFKSSNDVQIKCGGFNPDCTFGFTTGHNIDATAPYVDITSLYDGKNVPVDSAVEVAASASDNVGISVMKWFEGISSTSFDPQSDGPTGNPTPKDFSAVSIWNTSGLTKKQTYSIKVTADDLDTNTGEKSLDVVVVAKHCTNNKKDEDEVDIDCGGVDCMTCVGGPCTKNSDCSSGMCLNGVCVEQPIITNVAPLSGKAGTYVSIWGGNFGDAGTVTFLGPPAKVAKAPAACVSMGGKTWTNTYALVEVPDGAADGPIRIDNANSKLYDQTDDDRGPKFTFKLTNEEKPGLCMVDPDSGKPGKSLNIYGSNFGDTKGAVVFGQNYQAQYSAWGNATITNALVPVLSPGIYSVAVKHANGTSSNPLPFEVQSPETAQPAPLIATIDPAKGPKGQYITLTGQRFGTEPNLVIFYDKAGDKEYSGDSLFPNECANGWWRDNTIVIKVPTNVDAGVIKPAQFSVWVKRKDGALSNKVDFKYTDGLPGPGVCSIAPVSGPVGTDVTLAGENLGSAGQGNGVMFSNKVLALTTKDWTSAHVTAKTPVGAVSGGVYLQLGNATSNKVQFLVANCKDDAKICTGGDICCSDGTCAKVCKAQSFTAMYSWQLSTGAVPTAPVIKHFCDTQGITQPPQGPSPSPSLEWPGGDQVCVNPKPKIAILFDPVIRWPSQSDPFDATKLFKLIKCVGTGADSCEKPADRVEVAIANPQMVQVGQAPNKMSYVTFDPVDAMVPETVYYVYVLKTVHSADMVYGDFMDGKLSCPETGLGDCFRFRTRKDTGQCEISQFIMDPWLAEVEGSAEVGYTALPVPKDSICSVLTCGGLSLDWSTAGQNASKAQIEDTTSHTCTNKVKAGNQEAVTPPIDVVANLTGNASIKGLGNLVIRFVAPKLMDKFPNCTMACSNIWMWLQFNTAIKQTSLNDQTIKLYRCENESCLPELQDQAHLVPVVVTPHQSLLLQYQSPEYDKTFWRLDLKAPAKFIPGSFYVMRLVGGNPANSVSSEYGVLMPQTEEWKFRIRPTDDVCKPDHIAVTPEKSIKQFIGERELFSAAVMSPPDECSSLGQTVNATESFGWSVDDAKIAKLVTDPGIDADGPLPDGCSGTCKAKGSQGVYGAVAQCGNGKIETTDDNYCKNGKTPAGQDCVIFPMASGAGEQCDGGGLCGDNCLWKPTATVDSQNPGTCGDFTVQPANGEMCDPGFRCFDLPANASYTTGLPCTDAASVTACTTAGGKCAVRDWQGCSSGCKHLGAASVPGTTCGNGDIALGEDCDQGQNNGKGGCSANCLHVGSLKSTVAVCGNGILEPGETCEAPLDMNGKPTAVPAWCDQITCLRKGLSACAKPSDANCCGNGVKESGEDCDDGNLVDGDGCSQICLMEGSSWRYSTPSFCGDGKVGIGEQCEVGASSDKNPQQGTITGAGNGKLDGLVLAQILGDGVPNADNIISTNVNATYSGVVGKALFGVSCGHVKEAECDYTQGGVAYGLDDKGCCSPRPVMVGSSVKPTGTGVCRNALITASFATDMDTGSVSGNFEIAKELVNVSNCPDGTKELTLETKPQGAWQWLAFQWKKFWAWLTGEPTYAVWCTQTVSGTLSPIGESRKDFAYRLNIALATNTRYIVRFMGDPNAGTVNDNDKKEGIRTAQGVVAKADVGNDPANAAGWHYSWYFQTGQDICRINSISVVDTDIEHPGFFRKSQEEHVFLARAVSLNNGKPQVISPTQEYAWAWVPWVVNNPKIALHKDAIGNQNAILSQSTIQAVGVNGTAMVFAAVTTTVDKIDPNNSTQGLYIEGALPITVFLCDHPWPPLDANGNIVPLRDDRDTVEKGLGIQWLKSSEYDALATPAAKTSFLDGLNYFNFQTMYCRDLGTGVTPPLTANLVPSNAVDESLGVLRQYIMVFNDPAYKNDGIGIRIFQNQFHYTPLEWYKAQGFTGTPQSIQVDGFEAVKDADTVYVGFPNTKGLNENIYQNILVISRNPGSSTVTQNVFDQLVENFVFNTNFSFDNTNVCVEGGKTGQAGAAPYVDASAGINEPVTCVSDWDCLKLKPSLRCASFKYKLRHDLQRLADFKLLGDALDIYKINNGYYPKLSQGTFQTARTNSLWPSWLDTMATDLKLTKLPIDPVNKFVACGVCQPPDGSSQSATKPCNTDKDCPDKTYKCVLKDGFDPATCWNTDARQFKCPYMDASGQMPQQSYNPYGADEPWAQSRFYRYRALDGGARYELAANFEYPPPKFDPVTSSTVNWWYPPFQKELRSCYTSSTVSNGRICTSDLDCKPCTNPKSPTCGAWYPQSSCKPVGYRWIFKNMCGNDVTGDSGVCGDGIIGGACLSGVDKGKSCKSDGDCTNTTCGATEVCELGQTKLVDCNYQGKPGAKLQVCSDCKGWVDDPNLSTCRAKVECGNGRIDGLCKGGTLNGASCTKSDECKDKDGDHVCELQEVCDDGNLNGTYGHCGKDCKGINKYCGNGLLDPGETCDKGEQNGQWCQDKGGMCYPGQPYNTTYDNTCGSGCAGKAPYCGDGIVDGLPNEECDGDVKYTQSALCNAGSLTNQPCTEDKDCNMGQTQNVCGVDANHKSCVGVTIKACATGAKVCLDANEVASFNNGTFFNNPYINSTYISCETDTTCASKKPGSTCVSLNNGQNCQNDAQCSTQPPAPGKPPVAGVCRAYDTQHVRKCNPPGAPNQCKFENNWSVCQIAHTCGDGVVDPGEECDNGSDNAYWKACMPNCKKNVCGDGFNLLNVEECDSGQWNGMTSKTQCNGDANCEAVVCDPKYGTTCNNCSQQCKFLAKAGGYCGNSVKELGEQCDGNIQVPATNFDKDSYIVGNDLTLSDPMAQAAKGYIGQLCDSPPCQIMCDSAVTSKQKCSDPQTDATALTCTQLGYDFALNGAFNYAIHIKPNSTAAIKTFLKNTLNTDGCNFNLKTLEGVNYVNDKMRLLNSLYVKCGLMSAKVTYAQPGQNDWCELKWLPQDQWPSVRDFRSCVRTYGLFNGSFELVSTVNTKPSCTNNCKPAGCGMCSDESGDGKISGNIIDRVWLQAVPGARVTLQYRGTNVDQVMTDENGHFEFSNLNTREECAKFRLVVDKYDDNICTSAESSRPSNGCLRDITPAFDMDVDEGAHGGYWPFTTDEFSVDSFPWQEMMGMIYIYPRPAKGEGYVSYGRPTLIDQENWQQMKDCQKDPSAAECKDFKAFASWLPWLPQWAPHVVWPSNFARLYPVRGSGLPSSSLPTNTDYVDVFNKACNYSDRGTNNVVNENKYKPYVCTRDYNYLNQGWDDLNYSPHTAVFCPRLKWDRATNGCPLQGTTNCFNTCIDSQGAIGMVKQWFTFGVTDVFCNAFCKVGNPQCWTGVGGNGDDYTNGDHWCYDGISGAQVTSMFRYADPTDLSKPLPGLVDPLEIYFAAPEYEPISGEYYWTAPLPDNVVNKWIGGTSPYTQDPQAYALWQTAPAKAMAWREFWSKTKTKVYVTTDKGMYVVEPNSSPTVIDDFKRPFWHIASIGNNGTVTVKNTWDKASVYAPNGVQPDTLAAYSKSPTAWRPSGMACWNQWGASCRTDVTALGTQEPWRGLCISGTKAAGTSGVLSSTQKDGQNYTNVTVQVGSNKIICFDFWKIFGLNNPNDPNNPSNPAVYNNATFDAEQWNQINW